MKILAPINFSAASDSACEYACSLATALNAEVILLNVYDQPPIITETMIAWPLTCAELQSQHSDLMDNKIEMLELKYPVKIVGYAQMGNVVDEIIDFWKQHRIDLAVMLPGSYTYSIISKTKLPVLIVHKDTIFEPIKHITFATDFAELSDRKCFNLLFRLLKRLPASLQVIHVITDPDAEAFKTAGKLQLANTLSKVTYWYQTLEGEDAVSGIRDFVETHPTELLVMLSRHDSFLKRITGSGATRRLSAKTKLPTLIVEDQ